MKANPRPRFANFLTALAIVTLVIAVPVLAYPYPLSSSDIREAYLLGTRRDSLTTDFFAKYRHDLRVPAVSSRANWRRAIRNRSRCAS